MDKVEETGEGEGEIVSRRKIHHFGKPTVVLSLARERERERVEEKRKKKKKGWRRREER